MAGASLKKIQEKYNKAMENKKRGSLGFTWFKGSLSGEAIMMRSRTNRAIVKGKKTGFMAGQV
jgi:hypothetical protein